MVNPYIYFTIEIPQTTQLIIIFISNLEINQYKIIHLPKVDRVPKKTNTIRLIHTMHTIFKHITTIHDRIVIVQIMFVINL